MPDHTRSTAKYAMSANRGTAGNRRTSTYYRVGAYSAVMTNLDLVIYLYSLFNNRVFYRTTIYSGAGTDFNIIAHADTAKLMNLYRLFTVECKSKPVRTDYCSCVDYDVVAKLNRVVEGDIAVQPATITDSRISADPGARSDHAIVAQHHAFLDHGKGTDGQIRGLLDAGVD